MSRSLDLTQGKFTLLDDSDYERLRHLSCYAARKSSGSFEARISLGRWRKLPVHRFLLGANRGEQCDHINSDTLDNRRCNLRLVNNAQNQMNARKQRDRTSRFKGVCWNRGCQKWQAQIQSRNIPRHYLGIYDDEIKAALAYDEAARRFYGQYARVNFPRDAQ